MGPALSETTVAEKYRQLGVCGSVDDTQAACNVAIGEQHPFHVHINHVQVVKIEFDDPELDAAAAGGRPSYEQWTGLAVGDFRDSLPTPQGGRLVVRTHYADFAGDVIVHCHILYHEDMGMMQRLLIET